MLRLGIAVVLAALVQDPAKSDLTLTLAADKTSCTINDDVQVGVTLTNTGDQKLETPELGFEERSLSCDVTFEPGSGTKKSFLYALTRPDPHLAGRLPLTRVTLPPK